VSSSLTMVVAQRLVRKICKKCKCEESVPAEIRKSIGLPEDGVVYKGVGCSSCGYTGYKGRIGIFEVMPITETIRQLINKKASVADIRNQALSEGLVMLRDDALSKLLDGMTTIEEISRETAVIS
jgi:type IV pilus assembly protein PilB